MKKKKISEKDALRNQKIEKLKSNIREKLRKFSSQHITNIFCYPFGTKYKKGVLASPCYQQNIYICKHICRKHCDEFKRRTYLCRDIGCTYYPVCCTKPISVVNDFCESRNLLDERKKLNKTYNKYLHAMAIYRGLKLDPDKTFRYLRKEREKKNGQIRSDKTDGKVRRVKRRTKRTS